MADKLTPLIVAALTRAAAAPGGTPLIGTKSDPGLFPPTTAAKPAAKKAVEDGLLSGVGPAGKLYAATDKGLEFLLAESSPKQVLEDFCRVLEAREGEAGELLTATRRMADNLAGLKAAVSAVLPRVTSERLVAGRERQRPGSYPVADAPGPPNGDSTMTATLAAPAAVAVADPSDDLAEMVLARLADWAASAAAGQDCPLPELYRSLSLREPPPSIGTFHDCLRQLHTAGRVYLHPWTGPLYALPEPAYALLAGHNVAYYASTRSGA